MTTAGYLSSVGGGAAVLCVDPKTVDIETDVFIFYTFLNSNTYLKAE